MENSENRSPHQVPRWVYLVMTLAAAGLIGAVAWAALIRLGRLPG